MKRLFLIILLLAPCAFEVSAQTGANQLAGGTLASRPATCRVARREVYFVTDDAGDGHGPGSTECGPLDNQWRRVGAGGGASNLDALTDVTVSSPAANQALVFNGSLFVNRPLVKGDVGLGNVDNTSDASKPVSTAQQAALDLKADASALTSEASTRAAADTTLQANIDAEASARASAISSASTADRDRANHTGTESADTLTDGITNKAFTATERTKLSGIATGATANSSDATLLARANHTGTQPLSTISDAGTAAALNVPTLGNAASGEVVKGSDTRLSDSRTPTAHASSHASGGSDPVTLAQSQITNLVPDLAGKQAALGFTPENAANKDAASGYAGLDSSSLLKAAQFPAFTGDATKPSGSLVTTVVKVNGNTPGGTCTNQFVRSLNSSAVPTCASIAAADMPALTGDVTTSAGAVATTIGAGKVTNSMLAGSIDLTSKVTGALPLANGGTGQTAKAAAFDALSPNTTLGDLTYHNGTNSVRLAGNTTATKKFLTQTGNGSVSAAPGWNAIVAGDIPDLSATYQLAPLVARVTGSDAATSSTTLVDVTGLTLALLANTTYEFEAVLMVTTSADASGTKYAVNFSAAGATVEAAIVNPTSGTASRVERISAFGSTVVSTSLTTSGQSAGVIIKGTVTTGANAGNLTVQHLKQSSGTSTVRVGSYLKATR
jgi:hypothetical protein